MVRLCQHGRREDARGRCDFVTRDRYDEQLRVLARRLRGGADADGGAVKEQREQEAVAAILEKRPPVFKGC